MQWIKATERQPEDWKDVHVRDSANKKKVIYLYSQGNLPVFSPAPVDGIEWLDENWHPMESIDIKREVNHIFESGANETRILELIKRIFNRQWLPMEDAPKDVAILICEESQDISVGRWLYDDWRDTSLRKDCLNPIGWQPLPKPMKV